jgi:Baseplate J-like protein
MVSRLDPQRQTSVRKTKDEDGRPILNGIDFLEVAPDQRTLLVYFIHSLPSYFQSETKNTVPRNGIPLNETNILIQGGNRIQAVFVEYASALGNVLTVRVNEPGDRSTYTLQLVKSLSQTDPPDGIDSQLAAVDFVFAVSYSDFDCQFNIIPSHQEPLPTPTIDYLAKDYASFRQLMLNRLALTMPKWTERSPADIGVMLVELMAYAADYLSYHQDAVATESYLETARKRVSVRRHARLLDYFLHNGSNAEAWVILQVDTSMDGITLLGPSEKENRAGTKFLTKVQSNKTGLNQREYQEAIASGAQVFETSHDITLYASKNYIEFHTWGTAPYSLPLGATQAVLKDTGGRLQQQLSVGDMLIFEEMRGVEGQDANPTHRHAVRLIRVTPLLDKLAEESIKQNQKLSERVTTPQRLVEIEWATEDALPFRLDIAEMINDIPRTDISIARGNVVLVNHGLTVEENLIEVPAQKRYQPRLKYGPLAYHKSSHKSSLSRAHPSIWLQELDRNDERWRPQQDLLVSDRFARDFVVEQEEDGRAFLRFGDNQLGRQPNPGTRFRAIYRIGNPNAGNVGAESITHIYPYIDGINQIRNPLPAKGGVDAESLEQVRIRASQAFRTRQCAVTEDDYVEFAQAYPGVQKALATRRWTGSWETIFITVDRKEGALLDDTFRQGLLNYLQPYRLAGHTLELDNPSFVPLDIAMTVDVKQDYSRRDVEALLLETFSDKRLSNSQLGFFHPDNFTFAKPVYLSEIIKVAMQVPGVLSVQVTRFQRLQQPPEGELEAGVIKFERLEIPILKNAPNVPENGKIAFNLQGGLIHA